MLAAWPRTQYLLALEGVFLALASFLKPFVGKVAAHIESLFGVLLQQFLKKVDHVVAVTLDTELLQIRVALC